MKTKNKLLIFIVDDNKMYLDSLEYQILKKFKEKVAIKKFINGEECLKEMRFHPDVVILDYLLDSQKAGALNGIEVLKKIKQRNRKTIVLILSSQDKIDIAVDTLKYDAFDYIVKNESAFMKIQITLKIIMNEMTLTGKLQRIKNKILLFIVITVLAFGSILLLTQIFHSPF